MTSDSGLLFLGHPVVGYIAKGLPPRFSTSNEVNFWARHC